MIKIISCWCWFTIPNYLLRSFNAMASSYDPRKRLDRLAEKRMKCTLHAKFLEDCLSYELVPNRLTLKLKVSVGNEPEDIELQKSVNVLLERTSLHIVDIVKEGHLRKAKNLGMLIHDKDYFVLVFLLYQIINFRSQITYSFVKYGCSIYCFPHSFNSDMSKYGYLEVFQWVPWNSR